MSEKIREDRARRALTKAGYRLHKTPARSWLRREYGTGYQIGDQSNAIVAGCVHRQYEMTLEDVESFAVKRT
ncbi:hypothetical protein CQW49_02550 [Methylosinus trichosporium OB3b]|uniref:Uncharacterized protein n=1 Tax=Methylosinus trichosporium (strain ATCC 35070 / NCIMB 11131 / UNIQEM 75 / OB3b) TaxID=595536 RepID=A0A2D2CW04_METT3|nr:hypothetical protein CQW49_02550 [Methylosinus trichosporium OB3b]